VLEFVKALYASSTAAAQVGWCTSGPHPLLRGLRQGCPFSPVLFDAPGNGWLGKPGKPRCGRGAVTPGAPSFEEGLVAGLLLGDDLGGTGTACKRCATWRGWLAAGATLGR